ncbi:MAG: hypothetical protein GY913_00630 [Proteobacteria bacterium]|nr:hypothetical protein [Pseudomonadota bacterium]MCP4915402.1 hypothetical protein [Pseudomonadota bacterium]
MLSLLFAVACGDPPALSVQVNDVFGTPVADAQVKMDGATDTFATDAGGKAQVLGASAGSTVELMAGKAGYIHDFASLDIPAEGEWPPLTFSLYPEPTEPGFYSLGKESYAHLAAAKIESLATEFTTWHGLKDHPASTVTAKAGEPLTLVFNSTLRATELKRQDLRLSKLEYKETAEVTGVLGATDVELHLWVADASDIDYELKGTQSQDDYLIVVGGGLEPGVYAFHAQGVMHSTEADTLEKLPAEMQVAFPFEVK